MEKKTSKLDKKRYNMIKRKRIGPFSIIGLIITIPMMIVIYLMLEGFHSAVLTTAVYMTGIIVIVVYVFYKLFE